MEPDTPSKLIVEPTREALACCVGWFEGHARLLLADAQTKRAIFNLCFEFVCADDAGRMLDMKRLLIIEAFLKEAFAREGLRAPTVAQFFGMGRIKEDSSSDRQSIGLGPQPFP